MLLFFLFPFGLLAQNMIAEIPLKEKPMYAYVDRPGELYIRFESRIIRYDINGKETGSYSPVHPALHFEPRDGSRMFTYDSQTKRYGFAAFGKYPSTPLPEEYAVEPIAACSAGDNGLWIFDHADFSFKRVNLHKGRIDVEFKLPASLHQENIVAMREYQGFLFVATPTKLHLFSSMGKLLKSLEATAADFDFLGEEVYFRNNDQLIFFDLFDGTTRRESLNQGLSFIRLTDERRFLIYADRLFILQAQ
ncbi:MAG: hypothetical protein N2044_09570 [Cyclobacteriaceae bacterium]|nr:hypothetical protein [Cyclobacteriaceae bacterium]